MKWRNYTSTNMNLVLKQVSWTGLSCNSFLVEDELSHNVVVHAQELGDALRDPRLNHVQPDFGPVDLWKKEKPPSLYFQMGHLGTHSRFYRIYRGEWRCILVRLSISNVRTLVVMDSSYFMVLRSFFSLSENRLSWSAVVPCNKLFTYERWLIDTTQYLPM